MIRRLNAKNENFWVQFEALLQRNMECNPAIEEQVSMIIESVRSKGDKALIEFTRSFEYFDVQSVDQLRVGKNELSKALDSLLPAQRESLEVSAERIKVYHEFQRTDSWSFVDDTGTILGQKVSPIHKVGLYVPGGKASYPSTVLMNAIPARVAGVAEIILVVPTPYGVRNNWVLAAAKIAEIDCVFTIGGAQAIAALAYGTETVPAVDKIVGPGNLYVAYAKKQVFGRVGIDMVAGPSEVVIICDGSVPAEYVAMDLFAQAEHDENAQAILITTDPDFAQCVFELIPDLLSVMPRAEIIGQSLRDRGAIIVVQDLKEAFKLSNRIAPEHLELLIADPDSWVCHVTNAGAVFLGKWSSESLGDYCAGPSHVLPTSGTSRFSSPLSVSDFQKRTSIIHVSEKGAKKLGPCAATIATAEGLYAHAESANMRLNPSGLLEN